MKNNKIKKCIKYLITICLITSFLIISGIIAEAATVGGILPRLEI